MRIILISSEVVPYSKTGGLADVAGALPKALARIGCDVSVIAPRYHGPGKCQGDVVSAQMGEVFFDLLEVPFAGTKKYARVWRDFPPSANGAAFYFIEYDDYFGRGYIYGAGDDDVERFAFFSRAALELTKRLGTAPHIIHCNDWQTGFIPAHLATTYADDPYFQATRSLFTIHNLAYQGYFSPHLLERFGFSAERLGRIFDFGGAACALKAGLLLATALSTVSPRYAQEIQTAEFGNRMDGLLRARHRDLIGILNGVDYSEWNPETDRYLPANYSAADLSGKRICKQRLLERYQLPVDLEKPIIGIVSRLTVQKGVDLTAAALERMLDTGAYFVLLGSGDQHYENFFQQVRDAYPQQVGVYFGFSTELSHLVEAGADIFLMPSAYEPCGLNQMYSLKYGTVPLVRGTGGLDDSIQNYDRILGRGNGFKFYHYAATALLEKFYEAVFTYYDPTAWQQLQRNGMRADHSWEHAAYEYLKAYRQVVDAREPWRN